MEDTLDVDALMKAAAQAARRNDAAEAAGLLRRVLAFQEQTLGPDDAQLAPNLNNLALMLERQGDLREAERCYRRAYEVARRAAGPSDPLAQAARANLVEFLHATGKLDPLRDNIDEREAVDVREAALPEPESHGEIDDVAPRLALDPHQPPPALDHPRLAPSHPSAGPEPTVSPAPAVRRRDQPPAAVVSRERPGAIPWLILGLAAAALVAWLTLGREERSPVAPGETEPRVPSTAATDRPAPGDSRAPDTVRPAPVPGSAATSTGIPGKGGPPQSAPVGSPALTAVASVCQRLDRSGAAWRCDPLSESGDMSGVYYYTRVRTPRDVVVRHRWSYQGKPVRTVNLQVRANERDGFRTFSHQRVAGQPGQWDVALLTADGTVVDTRHFTVAR
jgi:hypothetical protein